MKGGVVMNNKTLIKTVKQAQKRNETAMRMLYDEYAKPIYHLALKLMKNKEDAEDIMQETFITAFSKLQKLNEPVTFQSWLGRIAANKCTDALRKHQIHAVQDLWDVDEILVEEENALMLPESALDSKETANMILNIIDELPVPQKMCIYYHYYQDIPVKQIAEILNANEHTVRSRLNLAKKKIREEVELLNSEQGVKLYSATPAAFTALMDSSAQTAELPVSIWEGVSSASSVMIPVTAGFSLKIAITLICALTVICGGIIGVILLYDDKILPVPEPDVIETIAVITLGNTSMNITMGGLAAEHDGWIYYSNFNDNGSLYRTNGEVREKLNNRQSTSLNISGGWVYYAEFNEGIYKIRFDGTDETLVYAADGLLNFIIIGDYIIFTTWGERLLQNEGYNINRIKLDGTGEEERIRWIVADSFSEGVDFHIDEDGWIYFIDKFYDTIFKIRVDGTEQTSLDTKALRLIVHDGYIFYNDENWALHRMNTDGTDNVLLRNSGVPLNAMGNYILVRDENLYRINFDGTDEVLIAEGDYGLNAINAVNIAGDWIYYGVNRTMFKVNLDGLNRQRSDNPNPDFTPPAFEPAPEINFGNTRSNLNNDGFLAYYAGYVYFGSTGILYRMRSDGSELTVIADLTGTVWNFMYMSIEDNLITFFSGVDWYWIDTDGTGLELIENYQWKHFINELGEWRYINYAHDNGTLYRESNSEPRMYDKIADDLIFNFVLDGEWIYYINADDNNRLYKIHVDGSGRQRLSDMTDVLTLNIAGDYVYFTMLGGRWIYKIHINGGEEELVLFNPGGASLRLNIAGDLIYFNAGVNDYEPYLFRIKDDGWEVLYNGEHVSETYNIYHLGENILLARYDFVDGETRYHRFYTVGWYKPFEMFEFSGENEWSFISGLEYKSGNVMFDPVSGRDVVFDFERMIYWFV
jgi:RNA polymerase sigma factor (sigma-70 family)